MQGIQSFPALLHRILGVETVNKIGPVVNLCTGLVFPSMDSTKVLTFHCCPPAALACPGRNGIANSHFSLTPFHVSNHCLAVFLNVYPFNIQVLLPAAPVLCESLKPLPETPTQLGRNVDVLFRYLRES